MFISYEETTTVFTFFRSLEFNDEQIICILRQWKRVKDDVEKISRNFWYLEKYLLDLGYTKEEIRDFASLYPKIMKVKDVKNYCQKRIEVLNKIKDVVVGNVNEYRVNMEEIRKILVDLSIPEKKIEYFFEKNISFIFDDPEHLQAIIDYLIQLGLTKEEIGKYALMNYKILVYDELYYRDIIEIITPYHIRLVDILRRQMRKKRALNLKSILAVFQVANKLNVNKAKFRKQFLQYVEVISSSEEVIYGSIERCHKIGFSDEEIREMLEKSIKLMITDEEVMKAKKSILMEYVEEDKAIQIMVRFPAYFTMSEENIRSKLEACKKTESLEFICENPKNLIQSAELTLARYAYFNGCFPRILFMGENQFEKLYGKSNQEIIEFYHKRLGKVKSMK